jgi:hypothetical protein
MGTPASYVINQDSFKGMGVDFGDINGDGLLDIYVSNLTSQWALTESHFLWLNTGQTERMNDGIAPFRQASEELGLSRSGWSWDCRLADLNNDGVLEALQANGFIQGQINKWPDLQSLGTSNNQLLHNPMFWPSLQPGDDLSGHETFAFFVRAGDGRYYDVAPKLIHGAAPIAPSGKGKGNARRAGNRSSSRGNSGPAGHRRRGGHAVAGRA